MSFHVYLIFYTILKGFIFILLAKSKPKYDACVVSCNINSISVEIRRAECFLSKFDLALLFCHLGARMQKHSPHVLYNALSLRLWSGACSGRRSRAESAGYAARQTCGFSSRVHPGRPVGSLSLSLTRCACGKQCITGHVFGCWLVGWVRVCTRVWFY
jgi:hypothetical protein